MLELQKVNNELNIGNIIPNAAQFFFGQRRRCRRAGLPMVSGAAVAGAARAGRAAGDKAALTEDRIQSCQGARLGLGRATTARLGILGATAARPTPAPWFLVGQSAQRPDRTAPPGAEPPPMAAGREADIEADMIAAISRWRRHLISCIL